MVTCNEACGSEKGWEPLWVEPVWRMCGIKQQMASRV